MRIFITALAFLISVSVSGQYTLIPDSSFESRLVQIGVDDVLDGQVLTANISSIESISLQNLNILDLTGIEDFESLEELQIDNNLLTELNLSHNSQLIALHCPFNYNLECLNLKNGNNHNMIEITADEGTLINCVEVDDPGFCYSNWIFLGEEGSFYFNPETSFSTNCENYCSTNSIEELSNLKKSLVKIVDALGREIRFSKNQILFHIYDDGSVEKKFIVE